MYWSGRAFHRQTFAASSRIPSSGGCQAPAALGRGVLFGSFDDGHGQGRDERACGADAFAGEAIEGAFPADELFGDELRPRVRVHGGARWGVTHWLTSRSVRQETICRAVP